MAEMWLYRFDRAEDFDMAVYATEEEAWKAVRDTLNFEIDNLHPLDEEEKKKQVSIYLHYRMGDYQRAVDELVEYLNTSWWKEQLEGVEGCLEALSGRWPGPYAITVEPLTVPAKEWSPK